MKKSQMIDNEKQIFKDDPWQGIERGTYPSGRRLYLKDERYWISRDSLNQLVFYIQDVCTTTIPIVEAISSVNINVEQYKKNEQRLVCTFTESSEKSIEKFGLAIKSIAVKTDRLRGIALFTEIKKELKEWSDFLKENNKPLSQSELIGFWGELYVISHYIMEEHDDLDAIRYWAGPSGGKKDIVLNSLAIEVKTTTSSSSKEIKISSLDQLDKTTEKLYLMHLFINYADKENGLTLSYLYEFVKCKIQHDFETLSLYTRRAGNIFERASSKQKNEHFLCSDINMYDVLDDFPKLLRSDVPAGVPEAKYSISISSIQPFNVTESLAEIIRYG
jgi:hypothetical protein